MGQRFVYLLCCGKSYLYLINENEKQKIWYNTFDEFFSTEDVFATDWEEIK